MKHIWIFFFSLAISYNSIAQEKVNDSVVKNQKYGLRLGLDLYKVTRSIYDKDFNGFEIVGDYRLTDKIYFAAEVGTENKTTDESQFNFTTKGQYLKIGADYNTHKNWLNMQNQIYIGARYGTSVFSQTLNNYSIYYNTGGFLGEHTNVISNKEFNDLSAHWIELVGGIKAEILNNLFLGFSVRLNYLITNKQPNNFENLYIPGYHKVYDGKFGVGFNYSISYLIPFYKK